NQGCAKGGCADPCTAAMANGSPQGCEFYSVQPAAFEEAYGSCFVTFLVNTWTQPVTIDVDYAGMALDVSKMVRTPKGSGTTISYEPLPTGELAPGQIAILFMSRDQKSAGDMLFVDCPPGISPGIENDTAIHLTGRGHAFHIRTSAPVAAFDIY